MKPCDEAGHVSERLHDRASAYRQRYGAVDLERKHIRILHLLPSDNEDVRCEMGQFSSDEPVPYFALSYAWGDPNETQPITVGGHSFPVTTNLKAALLALAPPRAQEEGLPLAVWVDAVCINQADDAEKGQQVRMMGEIYAKASETIVWLGPEGDDSRSAMQSIRMLAKLAVEQDPSWTDVLSFRWSQTEQAILRAVVEPLDFGSENFHQIPLKPLSALADRPWWGRVWAIQEVALAKDVRIVCGPDTVTSDEFQLTLYVLDAKLELSTYLGEYDNFHLIESICLRLWGMQDFRHDKQLAEATCRRLPLIEVMIAARFYKYQCTDLRDYVYGMLGLANDAIANQIEVDYGPNTTKTLFVRVAKLFLEQYGLDVLRYCYFEADEDVRLRLQPEAFKDELMRVNNDLYYAEGVFPGIKAKWGVVSQSLRSLKGLPPRNSEVPSWVPRWNYYRLSLPQEEINEDHFQRSRYHASLGLPKVENVLRFGINDSLFLAGVTVDKIAKLGVSPCEPETTGDWFHELALLIQNSTIYTSPEQKKDALWRSPLANEIMESAEKGHVARPEDGQFLDLVLAHSPGRATEADSTQEMVCLWANGTIIRWKISFHQQEPSQNEHFKRCTERYISSLTLLNCGWRLFVTRKGYLGLGPPATQEGDVVCIFPTASTPHILRKTRMMSRSYRLVGEAYVHGVMEGEFRCSKLVDFCLI